LGGTDRSGGDRGGGGVSRCLEQKMQAREDERGIDR